MKRLLTMVFPLLVTLAAAAQALPEPTLAYSQLPKYPPIAVAVRIEGTVKMRLLLKENGEVSEVEVISGHPMLKAAASDVVKTWRFDMPQNLYRTEWKYETEFIYRFSGKEVDEKPKLTVTLSSFHRVEVITDVVKGSIQYMCSHGPCPK